MAPDEVPPSTGQSGLPREVRWKALRALRRLGPRAVPLLTRAMRESRDPVVRQLAGDILAALSPNDEAPAAQR